MKLQQLSTIWNLNQKTLSKSMVYHVENMSMVSNWNGAIIRHIFFQKGFESQFLVSNKSPGYLMLIDFIEIQIYEICKIKNMEHF